MSQIYVVEDDENIREIEGNGWYRAWPRNCEAYRFVSSCANRGGE